MLPEINSTGSPHFGHETLISGTFAAEFRRGATDMFDHQSRSVSVIFSNICTHYGYETCLKSALYAAQVIEWKQIIASSAVTR
ncbi:MAG: hypothetical protein ACLPY5_02965 [Candidatus Bathyarchaeia archaeon]